MLPEIEIYPSTLHLRGSAHPAGDPRKDAPCLKDLQDRVIEEKLDGTHVAICFSSEGDLLLRHRNNWLDQRTSDPLFDGFVGWARQREGFLFDRLSERYVMHGEWMEYAHTVYYDRLPDLFVEMDIYDREQSAFLDTPSRQALLQGSGLASVPVCGDTAGPAMSLYRSAGWRDAARDAARGRGLGGEVLDWFLAGTAAEGLYVKTETNGRVTGRYKLIRQQFLDTLLSCGQHWSARPLIPNCLTLG